MEAGGAPPAESVAVLAAIVTAVAGVLILATSAGESGEEREAGAPTQGPSPLASAPVPSLLSGPGPRGGSGIVLLGTLAVGAVSVLVGWLVSRGYLR